MDFRFSAAAAAAAAAAPPFGGHFAVPPFHGSQQPAQRPLFPPIPDSGSAGLTADVAREPKKARIREENLARKAEEDRLLEQEVRRELQLERAMAERRREEQQLGVFRPTAGARENRFAEPRVWDSVQRLGVPPPLNDGPYPVPYTSRAWGREPQGSVQASPRYLERPESVEVPHYSEGEWLGSVHHSGNQGSLLPIFHRLGSTAGEYPGSAQAPYQLDLLSGRRSALPDDQRTCLPMTDHCEANIRETLPSSSLRQDYEFFTPLGNGLLGHHPEVEVSGGPPLATHPIGVDGPPIQPPSNSDIKASKSGGDCSRKGKEKAKVNKSAKKAPPTSNVVCHRCDNSGHKVTSCPFSKKEARYQKFVNKKRKLQALDVGYSGFNGICFKCGGSEHQQKDCVSMNEGDAPSRGSSCAFSRKEARYQEFVNKKRKLQALDVGNAGFNGICFKCGGSGHQQKDCVSMNEGDSSSREFDGICFQCGRSGHRQKDCLLLHEKDAPPHPFKGGKCFRCGKTGHLRKDCPLSDEEAHKCFHCGKSGHLCKDCPLSDEEAHEQSTTEEVEDGPK